MQTRETERLAAGLPRARAEALAALVGALTGRPVAADLPLAPALLYSDPALQGRMALPAGDPARLLIHEYQGVDVRHTLPFDTALDAAAERKTDGPRLEFAFTLAPAGAAPPSVEVRTGLRRAPAAEVAGAKGLAARAGPAPDWQGEAAVPGDAIARYCEVSGDANPLHLDARFVAEAGLRAALVPGLLLVSLLHPGVTHLAPAARVASLKARFVAPVYRDDPISLTLHRRGTGPAGERLRGFVGRGDGAAVLVDLVLAPA